MKVHNKIRRIRKDKGITQVFVAEKLGIPVQTYNGYELGRRNIKVELLQQIARILQEPIENFFANEIYETKNNSNTA
jgi:transcriptional regulator with XRE-family HTH domain